MEVIFPVWLLIIIDFFFFFSTWNFRLRIFFSLIRYSYNYFFLFYLDNYSRYSSFRWIRIDIYISLTFFLILFSVLGIHELGFSVEHPEIFLFFVFLLKNFGLFIVDFITTWMYEHVSCFEWSRLGFELVLWTWFGSFWHWVW